jgi:hypothetical protein
MFQEDVQHEVSLLVSAIHEEYPLPLFYLCSVFTVATCENPLKINFLFNVKVSGRMAQASNPNTILQGKFLEKVEFYSNPTFKVFFQVYLNIAG